MIRKFKNKIKKSLIKRRLASLKKKLFNEPFCNGGTQNVLNFKLKYNDGPNFYMQYKDEFINKVYKFDSSRTDPIIIDGGSNIGLSLLYFKNLYKDSRIISFEPDPEIFKILQENVKNNKLENISLYQQGLGKEDQDTLFKQDGMAGGSVNQEGSGIEIKMVRLSEYLNEPIDFLKLNIEGQEHDVIEELFISKKIQIINEMVIEYHGFPYLDQTLGDILKILDKSNFRYFIHDFDNETCSVTKPPFQYEEDHKWYCLIYAKNKINPIIQPL